VIRQHATADNARTKTLIRHASEVCTALVGAAAVMVAMAAGSWADIALLGLKMLE